MPSTIKLKRRESGSAGAPSTLKSAEPAFNEVDGMFYYGAGDNGAGTATSIVRINGLYQSRATRALLATDLSDMTLEDGDMVSDGTVMYIADSAATDISDLPGLLPFGAVSADHFGGSAGASVAVNSAAVQAAADYLYGLGGGTLHFGRGTYDFSGVSINPSIRVVGSGEDVTTLKQPASPTAHMITVPARKPNSDIAYFEISDCALQGPYGSSDSPTEAWHGIYLEPGDEAIDPVPHTASGRYLGVKVSNVHVRGFGGFGIYSGGPEVRSLKLDTTGSVTVVKGETITQAGSGATGVVHWSSTGSYSDADEIYFVTHTGTFNTANELTGSTSGALGANSVPTAVDDTLGVRTIRLTLTGSVSVTAGETLTQASTGATGVVLNTTTGTSVDFAAHKGVFNTSDQLTGSTSGALGANSVPTAIDTTRGFIHHYGVYRSTGRHAHKLNEVKVTKNFLGGVYLGTSADCDLTGLATGANNGPGLVLDNCVGGRAMGGEIYWSARTDENIAMRVIRGRKFQFVGAEINGRIVFDGPNGDGADNDYRADGCMAFIGCNFPYHENVAPLTRFASQIEVNDFYGVQINGGLANSRAQDTSVNTDHFITTSGDSRVYLGGVQIVDDDNDHKSFTVAAWNDEADIQGFYYLTSRPREIMSVGQFMGVDGGTARPTYSFGDSPTSGLYMISPDVIGMSADNTKVMSWAVDKVTTFVDFWWGNSVWRENKLELKRDGAGAALTLEEGTTFGAINFQIEVNTDGSTEMVGAGDVTVTAGTNSGDAVIFKTESAQRAALSATAFQIDVPLTGTAVQSSATDATAGRLLTTGASATVLSASPALRATYGGTANAITLTTGASLSSLPTGLMLRFRATAANTGATTINVDGIGTVTAKTITGAALPSGYIRTNVDTVIRYDGTNWIVDRQIERGSNANGEYVRFADGTQICSQQKVFNTAVASASGGLFTDGTGLSATHAAAFLSGSTPVGCVTVARPSGTAFDVGATVDIIGTTAAVFRITRLISDATARDFTVAITAIGRWF